MKRAIFIILSLLLYVNSIYGLTSVRTMKDFFISEPGYLFPLVSTSTRMDLVDYYNEGRLVDVKNNISDGTHFNEVKPNYISVQVSSSSKVDLFMIKDKNDTLIVAVSTYDLPAKDSKIEFFNTKWEKLDNKSKIKVLEMKDFISIPKNDKTKKETVLDVIDFPIISYTINPEDNTITAKQGLKDYMSNEDYKQFGAYLNDSITLVFKNGKFTKR